MEKEPQPESFTTVTVKDYPPELYVSEPPPAYKKPKSSLVQVVRIIAMTIIALTVTVGIVHLSSIYIQANAVHRLQQLQNRHEQKINQIPKSEPLVQPQQQNENEDDDNSDYNDKKSDNVEIKKHVRRDFMDRNKIDNDDDNSIETDDDKNNNPLHVKFPIQLDLDDLPEALIGSNTNGPNKNQKSRMNCIVEKKIAEKMVNHEPKNIQLPFGVNLTTDKGFEHLTGEKIIILCETGSEHQPQQQQQQKPQEQPQPSQMPQIQQNLQPIPFIRREPLQYLHRAPMHRQQMIFPVPMLREPEHEILGRYHMLKPQFVNRSPLSMRFPFQNEPKAIPEEVKEPMVFFSPEKLQFMHDFPNRKFQPATISLVRNEMIKKPPSMDQAPIIPQFIKNIAEEIIRDHIESQTEKPTVQNENNIEAQRLPLPEALLTEINRLPSPEMILSITAERENLEPTNIQIIPKENNDEDKQTVTAERENDDEEDSDETEPKPIEPAVMEMVHEPEMKSEQQSQQEKTESNIEENESSTKKEETSQPPLMVMMNDVSSTTVSANTANVREGRDLSPVQIPVQMIPQQDANLQERPHYVHPRSV